MSGIEISQIVSQLRSMAAQAGNASPASLPETSGPQRQDFAGLLQESVKHVNASQQAAGDLATRFEAGDERVELGQVIIAQQKASVSFQALTQVRNKLVSAYQEIMNMQV
jgi:flagellar hook-basal body complex protein FliE